VLWWWRIILFYSESTMCLGLILSGEPISDS
jgi:hypothetical protein